MHQLNIHVILVLLFSLGWAYRVPEPTIQVFQTGFSVAIPDVDGLEVFAFHGNINKELDHLEAGRFSKDVVKKCGNRWVFEDASARLAPGDKVYFWLFVIKERLGYRYDNGLYIVKDITPGALHPCHPAPPLKNSSPNQAWIHDVESLNAPQNFNLETGKLRTGKLECPCAGKLQMENQILRQRIDLLQRESAVKPVEGSLH